MAALGSADVTVTVLDQKQFRKERRYRVSLAFGDGSKTYPSGGVPLPTYSTFGLAQAMDYFQVIDGANASDIHWKYDYTNKKLRAYRVSNVPPIVVDEAVTVASNAGTLKYPPAYIIAASATISAADAPLRPVPSSITVGANEMKVNFTTGALTFFASDAVSAVKVTYIPQQPFGPFSFANLVVDEALTLNSSTPQNLANRAMAIQYLYQTAATAARIPFKHATASGVATVNFNSSGNTAISVNAAQNSKAAVCTYLKYSGLQQSGVSFIAAATISLSSQIKEWGKTAGDLVSGLIIPATGVHIVGNETTNYIEIPLGTTGVTAAAGLAKFEFAKQKITTAESSAQTAITDTPLLFVSNAYEPARWLQELTVNDAPPVTTIYGVASGW